MSGLNPPVNTHESSTYKRLGELYIESVEDFMIALRNNSALEELMQKSAGISDLLSRIEASNLRRFTNVEEGGDR